MIKAAHNEEEMIALGIEFAAGLSSGSVVALVGDLGAGKTHFSKGIVQGLESGAAVTSPTFALVNEYPNGRVPIFHFDFYRLDEIEELEGIGWEEYLDQDGIILVEWADKFPESMPAETLWCTFTIDEHQTRIISFGESVE